MKLWIFTILYYFSAGMLVLIFARYIVYALIRLLGIGFWIFPNLDADDKGVLESFMPFLSIKRMRDSWPVTIFRCLLIIVIGLYCYQENTIPLPIETTIKGVNAFFDYGKDKLIGNDTNAISQHGKTTHSIDDIIRMTEEEDKREKEERERVEEEEEMARAEAEDDEDTTNSDKGL